MAGHGDWGHISRAQAAWLAIADAEHFINQNVQGTDAGVAAHRRSRSRRRRQGARGDGPQSCP